LPQPATVRLVARDGIAVAGAAVSFAPPPGGKVGAATVTSDANGTASTSLTLGSAVGPQTFTASSGTVSVPIPATATAGDPSAITIVSGNGQTDTVRHSLRQPLVVKVGDQFGNAVSGVAVNWTRTSGSGTASAAESVSGSDGTASITYTLGSTVGAETISASVVGITSQAVFVEHAVAGAPAAMSALSGDQQTARILE